MRNRSKKANKKSENGAKAKNFAIENEVAAVDDDIERQVRVKNIEYKPMDVEEAVLQMDLTTDNFLVFTNARSDRVNVLYRRKDGHYGLIQPSN